MSLHQNSLEAYWSGQVGEFSRREKEILAIFRSKAGTFTDREIMLGLGFTEMNCVRPRITELIQRGVLEEVGSLIDNVTQKRVRRVRLVLRPAHQTQLAI